MDDQEAMERFYQARRMARKLAHNRSNTRVVRKLPRSMIIEVKVKPRQPLPVRRAINANKRLTYILLLGASLCAYIYDADPVTLLALMDAVGSTANSGLEGLLGRT